ncbi:hypothetical protein ACH5RR_022793 [Cinchona calisaya]|uniref:Gag-pol polyprotein n=1 Tax=Cinchona calisaya TaxID=153742 RepID=A0ABD2ZAN6_9GENT
MPIESLINSLASFELKLKYKIQDENEARAKRSIALKASQKDTSKKPSEKCYRYDQLGYFANEYLSKKNKEGRKPHFSNFQITRDDCNLNGEVEKEHETTQMTFMAIGDNQVSSSYDSCNDSCDYSCDNDDNVESFIFKMYEYLKESYARNKSKN